jgi:hypothetical protein
VDSEKKYRINDFSSHLFWDVDPESISIEKDEKYIIHRVLEYGFYKDWQMINSIYGLSTIVENTKKFRNLDKKALHFISTISKTPLKEFRCYTYQQSIPKHWDF